MCDFENGFILCKCNDPKAVVHNKNSRRNRVSASSEYTWRLNRYVGKSQEMEIGRYSLPDSHLISVLTSSFVLNELNSKNCFDFEYLPNEGDNLELVHTYSKTRIEFIFKNGKWLEDHYSPFDHIVEKVEEGKIIKC